MKKNHLAISMGERIRKMREKYGITQFELSEAIDISPSYMGLVERGERQLSTKRILELCRFFKVSTDYILLGTDEVNIQSMAKDGFISESLNEYERKFIYEVCKTLVLKRLGKIELDFILNIISSYVSIIVKAKT